MRPHGGTGSWRDDRRHLTDPYGHAIVGWLRIRATMRLLADGLGDPLTPNRGGYPNLSHGQPGCGRLTVGIHLKSPVAQIISDEGLRDSFRSKPHLPDLEGIHHLPSGQREMSSNPVATNRTWCR